MWRMQTMTKTHGTFDMRVALCEAWRGLRQAELNTSSGMPDAEFVHRAGFTGGAWSKESAITMALMSIKEHNEKEQQSPSKRAKLA